MTREQLALIQRSWAAAQPHGPALAAAFYLRLFEIWPHARHLFRGTDLAAQQGKLLAMLDEIVRRLETPAELIPKVAALGKRHAEYGVDEADYAPVGDALLWAFEAHLGDAFTPETKDAWHAAYRLLEAVMIRATRWRTGEWPVVPDWRTSPAATDDATTPNPLRTS